VLPQQGRKCVGERKRRRAWRVREEGRVRVFREGGTG